MRIAVVAPSTPIDRDTADRVTALAALFEPGAELLFHRQCFLQHKHFAGPDEARLAALLEVANDPAVDAVWFARGGYGAGRIVDAALAGLRPAARGKTYLGYSDAGYLLAGLFKAGHDVAHGPMPRDVVREGGEAAIARSLAWLCRRDPGAVEPMALEAQSAAFNLTILSHLIGTPLEPDLSGRVLMLEEVSEHMYRIDRAMCHIVSSRLVKTIAGIRLGRCSDVPANDPEFGDTAEEVLRFWCARAGVPFLGDADIGHDGANKVVPFA